MSIRCCFESVWQTPSRFLSNKSNPTKVQNLTDFLFFLTDEQFFDLPEKLTLFFLHREIQQIYVALRFFGFQSYPMTSLLYPVYISWTFIGPDMAMTSMDMTGSWKNLMQHKFAEFHHIKRIRSLSLLSFYRKKKEKLIVFKKTP